MNADPLAEATEAASEYFYHKGMSDKARETLRLAVLAAIDSGVSQREAARVTGVDRPTIHRWVHAR